VSLLSSSASALCELYDLVVAEPDLPGMSGYALCSWYKQACRDQPCAPVDFVLLSSSIDAEACAAFEVDLPLSKPLSAGCFAHAIRLWLAPAVSDGEVGGGRTAGEAAP